METNETKPTPGPWGAAGTMIVTPPIEEQIRRLDAKEFPFTVRRIAICEPSYYASEEECLANAAHIVKCVNVHDELLAACQALDAEQRYYEEHAGAPMPGNSFYSDRFMRVVLMARAAIAEATAPPTDAAKEE